LQKNPLSCAVHNSIFYSAQTPCHW